VLYLYNSGFISKVYSEFVEYSLVRRSLNSSRPLFLIKDFIFVIVSSFLPIRELIYLSFHLFESEFII